MPGKVTRGTVVEVNLDPIIGREISKSRPCVVIQNDFGNAASHCTIVAAISGAEHHPKPLPFFAFIPKGEAGLTKDSYVLANQIRTVHEKRSVKTYGRVGERTLIKRCGLACHCSSLAGAVGI
jgi:mRNA interferase MazF